MTDDPHLLGVRDAAELEDLGDRCMTAAKAAHAAADADERFAPQLRNIAVHAETLAAWAITVARQVRQERDATG